MPTVEGPPGPGVGAGGGARAGGTARQPGTSIREALLFNSCDSTNLECVREFFQL